jgi:hypothetical protein
MEKQKENMMTPFSKDGLRFEWHDDPDFGSYECFLYENGSKIDDISFEDYTSDYYQESDRERGCTRPYSFRVHWRNGWHIMSEGFDYDDHYDKHWDEEELKKTGWPAVTGGYQGKCIHTVDDIKKWCENCLAQKYLGTYYNTLRELEQMKARAEWFEAQGFAWEEEKED